MCVCHLLHFSFLFIFPLFGYSFLPLMALRLFNPGGMAGGWLVDIRAGQRKLFAYPQLLKYPPKSLQCEIYAISRSGPFAKLILPLFVLLFPTFGRCAVLFCYAQLFTHIRPRNFRVVNGAAM